MTTLTTEFKQRVVEQLLKQEKNSGLSAKRFAMRIGIDPSQWSRLKNGDLGVLSEARYISIARKHDVEPTVSAPWKTVETATFTYIYGMLETCQRTCVSVMLVDIADIGKSHTAKYYARQNQNAVYLDCSLVKTRQLFVRELARQFGVTHTGTYHDVFQDLTYYLNTIQRPLIILDEAGDLSEEAFREIKSLWNATEFNVGWVIMGADGLKARVDRSIGCKKVGYTEIFRRFSSKFRKVTPDGREALEDFRNEQVHAAALANAPQGTDIQKLVAAARGSLTNLYNMIRVLNQQAE